jgi:hypothetical protein
MSSRSERARLGLLLTSVIVCATSYARAATPDECIAAHTEGQRLGREGRLLAAHVQFLACGADTCPAIIRKDCVAFDVEVETALPSVVLALVDAQGREVRDAGVTIDDGATALSLDGRDVALDPGSHRVRFTTRSGRWTTLTVVLGEGEKLRRVVGTLPPLEPPPSSSFLPVPTLAYVFGGVGVAALGSFTYFAISGRAKQTDLESHCAPHCSQGEVDTMRTRYLIADVSLAVSLVSLGAGAYFFFADPFGERSAGRAAEKRTGSLGFDVSGGPGLAAASLSGQF